VVGANEGVDDSILPRSISAITFASMNAYETCLET